MKAYQMVEITIDEYLRRRPHLSRKAVAERAGISNAYLTMVLHGKRSMTEDLAIKILSAVKRPGDVIETMLKKIRLENNMPAVVKYYQERGCEETRKRLHEDSSRLLSMDIDLLNCFEDIVRMGKIHGERLVDLYGRSITQRLDLLVHNQTLKKDESGYYYADQDGRFMFEPADAITLMQTSLQRELVEWKGGANVGKTNTYVVEVPDESYRELLALIDKQIKEVQEFVAESKEKAKTKKGRRVNVIHALTGLKH